MSRNSGGTYSLPSGNPVVTGTTVTSTWANTTLTDVASELTNSLERNGKGAMLAPLRLPNGTRALPAMTFDSDTDSGVYRAGAGDVRMSVNDTDLQTWTGTTTSVARGLTATQSTADTAAITATGNGTGPGVTATGGATAPGASLAAGTAATGATRQNALALTNGDLNMAGVANPNSTVALANKLSPANIVKAWAHITTNGAGGATLVEGCNISGVAISGADVQVTFATAFTSQDAICPAGVVSGALGHILQATQSSATVMLLSVYSVPAAGQLNLAATASRLWVVFCGKQ